MGRWERKVINMSISLNIKNSHYGQSPPGHTVYALSQKPGLSIRSHLFSSVTHNWCFQNYKEYSWELNEFKLWSKPTINTTTSSRGWAISTSQSSRVQTLAGIQLYHTPEPQIHLSCWQLSKRVHICLCFLALKIAGIFSSIRALNMQMWDYLLSNCLNCYFKLIRPNQHIISSQMITYNQLFMSGQLIRWLPANPMTWSDQLVMSISGLNWLLLKLGVDIFIEVYLDNI